jgi:hypothetical protein
MIDHRFSRPTGSIFVLLICLLISVSLASAAATKPLIADAVIDPDRSRMPEGKLTTAVHVSLSPVENARLHDEAGAGAHIQLCPSRIL